MRLLLDTHALLWWLTDDPNLSNPVREILSDSENEVFVSAASAWEIATKQRIGKLKSLKSPSERLPELIIRNGFQTLQIDIFHSIRAGSYDVAHRDPFDRMLAAQCELEAMPLATLDSAFEAFDIKTIW